MKNIALRILIDDAQLKHKDIAHHLGITPEWFSKLLAAELSHENKDRIERAIDEMKKHMN